MAIQQEETTLRQFCKIVDDLHECRFIRRAKVQDHTITVSRDGSNNHFPTYDRDEFRAFATLFRKLVANKEPTQLFKVMKIIKRHAPDDKKDTFKSVKAELTQLADCPPIGIVIGTAEGKFPYTPRRICDVLFNGMVFHTDPGMQCDVDRLLDYEPFVMAGFMQYICGVVNVASHYASLVEQHSFFQAEATGVESATSDNVSNR